LPTPYFQPRDKRKGKYPELSEKTIGTKTIQTTLSNPGEKPESLIMKGVVL